MIQWITPETVAAYLGDDVSGIAVAATLGILINVPLLFEIPLVAVLMLVGMGAAPAAALLFGAAAAGPFTLWGLARVMPKKPWRLCRRHVEPEHGRRRGPAVRRPVLHGQL